MNLSNKNLLETHLFCFAETLLNIRPFETHFLHVLVTFHSTVILSLRYYGIDLINCELLMVGVGPDASS